MKKWFSDGNMRKNSVQGFYTKLTLVPKKKNNYKFRWKKLYETATEQELHTM